MISEKSLHRVGARSLEAIDRVAIRSLPCSGISKSFFWCLSTDLSYFQIEK